MLEFLFVFVSVGVIVSVCVGMLLVALFRMLDP